MNEDWIIVGCFGRVHGIKGFISINSYTEPKINILNYRQWQAYINKKWQSLTLLDTNVTSKHILVKVKDFTEREQAITLTNSEIRVHKNELPMLEEGEYYWYQLIGLQVVNQQGEKLGEVTDIIPTGSNDVLAIQGKDKRHLVPYLLDRFVMDINLEQQKIIVDWDLDF